MLVMEARWIVVKVELHFYLHTVGASKVWCVFLYARCWVLSAFQGVHPGLCNTTVYLAGEVTTGSGCAAVPLLFGPIGKWEMLGQMKKSEISGSHGGEYEDDRQSSGFRMIALIMEAASSSETSIKFCRTRWRYNPVTLNRKNLGTVQWWLNVKLLHRGTADGDTTLDKVVCRRFKAGTSRQTSNPRGTSRPVTCFMWPNSVL